MARKNSNHTAPGECFEDGTIAPPIVDRYGNALSAGARICYTSCNSILRGTVINVYWSKGRNGVFSKVRLQLDTSIPSYSSNLASYGKPSTWYLGKEITEVISSESAIVN